METLKIALMSVGDALVFMIDCYPTAYMIAVDDEQAAKIRDGIDEMLAKRSAAKDPREMS